ncbi:MAG: hypothetical protein K2H46_01890 [Muribaculaceae bacterium]|nr:hypothetical protein [Muribaculaceae bacterium]
MRQLLLLLILPFFMAAYSVTEEPNIEIILYEEEPTDEDIDPEGKRSFNTFFLCNMDQQKGVTISNYNGSLIGYVIEDPQSETVLISFTEEEDFLDFIFSYTGEVRIRLLTDYYPLVGYIRLNNQK